MDIYTKSIIQSWAVLILTVTAVVLCAALTIKAVKYFRAVWKRVSFMHRLKSACRESGTEMTVLSSPYRSVFKPSETSELLLKNNDGLYSLKFFPCLHRNDTYQFDEEGSYHRISNFKPIFLNVRYYSHGAYNSATAKILMPKTLQYNDTVIKNSAKTNFSESDIADAKPILILNPVPAEVLKVDGSGIKRVFDGDELCGYTAYSAAGLLKNSSLFPV